MSSDALFAGSSLCVVGNINRDVKTAALRAGAALFKDGETPVSSIIETIGGGGANSAFAAASLGARVSFAGKVGADALGDRLQRNMENYGIDARLSRDPQNPSGTSIALTFESGHRHFVSCLPASSALAFDDIDLRVLEGHSHLLRADVWFPDAMLFGGNRLLFEAARRTGLTVSLDVNWDPQWGRAPADQINSRKGAVREILPLVSLVHGNVRELMEFADAPDLDSALRRLTGWGAAVVIVHHGAQGAGYYENGQLIVEPAAPVQHHVNTTGTGDVLSVCMMLLHHRTEIPVAGRLRLANAVVGEFIEGRRTLIPPLAD
jgi:2-dehydro-3-deoxygluconokinase